MFKSVSEIDRIRPNTFLIVGDTGTGKTHLSLTFPKPIFFIDLEDGISRVLPNLPDTKDINIARCISDNLGEAYDMFSDALSEAVDGGGKTLVIDSMTVLDSLVQYHVVRTKKNIPPEFVQLDIGSRNKYHFKWFQIMNKMLKSEFENLVFIARKVRWEKLEGGKLIQAEDVRPKSWSELPYYADYEIHCYSVPLFSENNPHDIIAFEYRAQLIDKRKRREGKILKTPVITSPTFEKLMEVLRNEEK